MNARRDGGAYGRTPLLWIYRAAWEPALWIVRILAAAEKIAGGNLWPARWRLADRLGWTWPSSSSLRRGEERGGGTIWLHAASLGECKGLWAFAQTLGGANAGVVLTTNTIAGLDFLRGRIAQARAAAAGTESGSEPEGWTARLAPLDHPRTAEKFLRVFNVRALVLFEVELWPHWMRAARRALRPLDRLGGVQAQGQGVPVFWISARAPKQARDRARRRYAGNRFLAAALRRVLRDVAWIQAQTEEDARALRALGGRAVETGGDLRGLHYLEPDGPAARRGIAFVSVHAEELPALVPGIAAERTGSPLLVFPRKMDELPAFRKALEPLGFALHSERPDAHRVIVDSFGRVAETLARVRTAVIGGSFVPRGGHNLWEPLQAGARIVTGPHHGNQDYLARKLAEAGLLHIAQDAAALAQCIEMPDAPGSDPAAARDDFILRERLLLKRAADDARMRVLGALILA